MDFTLFNPVECHPTRERSRITLTYIVLILANVAAGAWACVAFSGSPALLGAAVLAYTLGLRHALDADHIAAIDNVVRKLMREGRAPSIVGFFFSLGHSTIVIIVSLIIMIIAAVAHGRSEEFSGVGGVIGTLVSALFLLLIGVANLSALKDACRTFSKARRGEHVTESDLDMMVAGGGMLTRIFRPMLRVVTRSWHMYPVGFMFGLGFDTATEIGLLGISATRVAQGIPFWDIMVFPALFTAAMALVDTTDSMMMTGMYGWAFDDPIRKVWYNLTITAVSVVVAVLIGSTEMLGLVGDKLRLKGGFWVFVSEMNSDLSLFGCVVVGVFAAGWAISFLIYRGKRYDALSA